MNERILTHYCECLPFVTKDGSSVRELMHPERDRCRRQSLAEAVIEPGMQTALHRHGETEEIYHVLAGSGMMTLGDERFPVSAGDTVCIAPGTAHCIANGGIFQLRILCCCTPAYSHCDTELLEVD